MNDYTANLSRKKCSIPGQSECSYDWQCLQSCPFGDIPAERMACIGTFDEKQFGRGKCSPAWYEEGDVCTVTGDNKSCAPTGDGYNDLYCRQNQLVNPNNAPGFSQAKVGEGTCERRTLAATKIGAHNWLPAVPASYWNGRLRGSGVAFAETPVQCSKCYLNHLRDQGLLQCKIKHDPNKVANQLCNNVQSAMCDADQNVVIQLY